MCSKMRGRGACCACTLRSWVRDHPEAVPGAARYTAAKSSCPRTGTQEIRDRATRLARDLDGGLKEFARQALGSASELHP